MTPFLGQSGTLGRETKSEITACLFALDQAKPGSSYIVADGTPRRWSDICQYAATQWNIPIPEPTIPKDLGKRLSPQKILEEFNYKLKHTNLYEELNKIENNGAESIEYK